MGVSKESISKFLIGNRFHVKLRILSPYSNRIFYEDWRNDREVNTSANPWKKQRERQSKYCDYRKEIEKEKHTHTKTEKQELFSKEFLQKLQ